MNTIEISGKKVRMRVSARIPYEYRELFGKDIISLMVNGEADINDYSRLAWLFARSAGEEVYDDLPSDEAVLKWLEDFDDMFAIYAAIPEITQLWINANKTLSTPKKKREQR